MVLRDTAEPKISELKEFAAKLGEAEQSRKAGLEKLEIVLFASAFWRGGRKGGLGGIPPAEPVNEIGSDIFKYTPQRKICFAN